MDSQTTISTTHLHPGLGILASGFTEALALTAGVSLFARTLFRAAAGLYGADEASANRAADYGFFVGVAIAIAIVLIVCL
jgi:hypothetical protein